MAIYKILITAFSFFSLTKQNFIGRPLFFSKVNKNNIQNDSQISSKKTPLVNITTETPDKDRGFNRQQIKQNEIITFVKIWLAMVVFTYPVVFFPSKNY
jgi:hypothetical protein